MKRFRRLGKHPVLVASTAEVAPEEEPWPIQRARLERQALEKWDTDENTGTCLLCDRPMREHPPGRMLRADPVYCEFAASVHPRSTADG